MKYTIELTSSIMKDNQYLIESTLSIGINLEIEKGERPFSIIQKLKTIGILPMTKNNFKIDLKVKYIDDGDDMVVYYGDMPILKLVKVSG